MALLRDLTSDERRDYFRGIHPIWGGGLDAEGFQTFQRRLADAPEVRGRYRVLGWFEEGLLLAAMKAYALQAVCAGQRLEVLGVGAVFTEPALRRHGYAAAMLRAALRDAAGRGARAAVLFSDIPAHYYEQLGFRRLQSLECRVDVKALPRLSGGVRPATAGDEDAMTALFASARPAGSRFSFVRDGWTLRFQLRRLRELARARGVGEPEWGLVTRDGAAAAMLRFGRDAVDLLDAAWTTAAARDLLLGGLRDCLQRTGRTRLHLWPAAQLRGLFAERERAGAVAMIAPLDDAAALPGAGEPADLTLLDHI